MTQATARRTAVRRPPDGPGQVVREAEFTRALDAYDLDAAGLRTRSLVVPAGEPVLLRGLEEVAPLERLLTTEDLDQFKAWVGVADELIAAGTFLAPPAEQAPAGPCSARHLDPALEPGSAEWRDLELAALQYLFGDSRTVEGYAGAVARHLAPFAAALYAAERIEIPAGATLVLAGYPSVLVVKELVIHAGGALKLLCPARVLVESLVKVGE